MPSNPVPPPALDRETTLARDGFDRALAIIEGELSVVFPSVDRVAAACDALAQTAGEWTDVAQVDRLRRLVPLLHRRTDRAQQCVVAVLRRAAHAAAEPWPVLEDLLASADQGVCCQVLDDIAALVASGRVTLDAERLQRVAAVSERVGSPLLELPCLERLSACVRCWKPARANGGDSVVLLMLDPVRPALRRLAARLLDLEGSLPSAEVVRRVLDEDAARLLLPPLAYTRARHVDLVQLVRSPGGAAPIAAALPAVVEVCGPSVANALIGELGWHRVNLGLTVERCTGVSVDDSLPFLLTPAEAALVLSCPGGRRVSEEVVAIGHGGVLEEAEAGPVGESPVARFRAYNLAHAEVLGDILDIAPLTTARIETILAKMDHIVAEFAALFASQSDECAVLPGLYAGLKGRILQEMAHVRGDRVLSIDLTRLVQMFEDPPALADVKTLHGLKRYLHQRGLALGFGLLKASQATNRTVDFALVSSGRVSDVVRRIDYVDVEPDTSRNGALAIPYPVAVVVDAFKRHLLHGHGSLPRVQVFCYGNEVHYFVSFRNHPVFIRIDYSPPLSGGMIDLAYYGVSKNELDQHPAIGLEGVRAMFARLDFQVEVDNTRIHARYDKERALDLADLCEKAEALFRLAPYMMDVDWMVGSLRLPPDARRRVGAAWADFFARWGVLPADGVLTADRTGIVVEREPRPEGVCEVRWTGEGPYTDRVSGRPRREWAAEVHAELARRGLHVPPVLHEGDVGQITLEKHLLRHVRDALARGALIDSPDGIRAAPPDLFRPQHEAERFAAVLASDDERVAAAARLARLAGALERTLRFTTTGDVNGYEVQRCDLALRNESLSLFALRDGAGIIRLAMFAQGGRIYLSRRDHAAPWSDNVSHDAGVLASMLRRNNFLPSWIDASADAESDARSVKAVFATPGPMHDVPLLARERALEGVRASPGRAAGLARLGTRGRRPADLAGGILFASSLGPDDAAFLFHAAAVVSTGGGILSHAGLMAVQFGRPAMVIRGEWRDEPDGSVSLVYRRVEYEREERDVAGWPITMRRAVREAEEQVREGDVVVVDADEGWLRVLGQSQTALALHDGLRSLQDASRRLATATSADLLTLRGHRLRALHQLERLLARLSDPPLVQHATWELLTAADAGVGGSVRDQAHLLGVLRDNPAVGPLAGECVQRVARQVERRFASAYDDAQRLVPAAGQPYEVLCLRRAVRLRREALDQVAAFIARDGAAPLETGGRELARIDAAARERLRLLLDHVLAEVNARPGRVRHLVRLALRVSAALGTTAAARDVLVERARELEDRDSRVVGALANRCVLWPADGGLEIEPLAGSKAANLGELERLGAAGYVPSWFVVTDHAFREVLAGPAPQLPAGPWDQGVKPRTLAEAIDAVVVRTDAEPSHKAALIARLWAEAPLPPALQAEVVAAHERLAGAGARPGLEGQEGSAEAPYFAIRSSAREEDTEAAIRAGEFDTFLFVRGVDGVLQHLRRAWSGLWSVRAIHERAVAGRSGRGEGGGVIVQRMVSSRVSGVLQTTNAATGRTREMVIDVGLGLGEGIVSGAVAADHVVVSKDADPETAPLDFAYVAADKRERVVFDAYKGLGTVRTDVLAHQRLRAAIEYAELVELVQVATRLESAYGYPLDIEFGIEGACLRLLQVRPLPGSLAVWRETLPPEPRTARTERDTS